MYNQNVFKTWTLILQLGLSVIIPILLLIWLASCLKNVFDIDLMLVFIIIGVLVGVRNAFVLINGYLKSIKNSNHESELIKKHLKNERRL